MVNNRGMHRTRAQVWVAQRVYDGRGAWRMEWQDLGARIWCRMVPSSTAEIQAGGLPQNVRYYTVYLDYSASIERGDKIRIGANDYIVESVVVQSEGGKKVIVRGAERGQ